MSNLFITIVNMSIAASWIVPVVLVLRLLLKRAPKWIAVLLWAVVAVRLICPLSVESDVSLIPETETINPTILTSEPTTLPVVQAPAPDATLPDADVTPVAPPNETITPPVTEPSPKDPWQVWIPILAAVWVGGMGVMLLSAVISYARLKYKVCTAVRVRDNIFQSEHIPSPFVLGVFRPRMYLPFGMAAADEGYVIEHEQAHIRRGDHWWKPLGFLILTLHWFNPLMWLAYILLCRDIELACDEKVIKTWDNARKADYSQALLHCSVSRRTVAACPLAFGEVGVKDRVKTVLNYRKPAFWIVLVAVVASIAVAVCFLTNPKKKADPEPAPQEQIELSDKLEDSTFRLDGVVYKLPMPFSRLTENGWTLSDPDVKADSYFGGLNGRSVYMTKNGYTVVADLYNTSGNAVKAADSTVIGIEVTAEAAPIFQVAGEIAPGMSADKVMKKHGTPTEQELFDSYADFLYGSNEGDTYGAHFLIFPGDLSGSSIHIKCATPAATLSEKAYDPPSYLASYLPPAELGIDTTVPHFAVGGDVYTLPLPVKTFLDRGWTVTSTPAVVVDGQPLIVSGATETVTLKKGEETIELVVVNESVHQQPPANCVATGVTLDEETAPSFELPSGIVGGMTAVELRGRLSDAFRSSGSAGPHDNYHTYYDFSNGESVSIVLTSKRDGVDYRLRSVRIVVTAPNVAASNPVGEATVAPTTYRLEGELYTNALNADKITEMFSPHEPIYTFDTAEELQNFKKKFGDSFDMDKRWDEVPSFSTVTADYDEAFFKDNSIILIYIATGSGTYRYDVDSVDYNTTSLTVHVRETTNAMWRDAMCQGWFMTITIPDSYLINCTEFDSVIVN